MYRPINKARVARECFGNAPGRFLFRCVTAVFVTILVVLLCPLVVCGSVFYVHPGESIQAYINAAAPRDTIILNDGIYSETLILYGKDLTIASQSFLDNDTLHIAATRLSPDEQHSDTLSSLVYAYSETCASLLYGLTIENGLGTRLESGNVFVGGGIYVYHSGVTMHHCTISNCSTASGGGMSIQGNRFVNNASARLSECTFTNCKATQFGGAMSAVACSLSLSNCTFLADTADISDGAATLSECISHITTCRFLNDHGAVGGLAALGGELHLAGCIFDANSSNELPGLGGHLHTNNVLATVTGCVFTGSICPQPLIGFAGSVPLHFIGNLVELNRTTMITGTLALADRIQGEIAYNIIRDNDNIRGAAIYSFSDARMRVHHNVIARNTAPPGDPGAFSWITNSHTTLDSNIIMGHNMPAISILYPANRALDARHNYWGDPRGPYHPTQNPAGQGDTLLSDSVLFIPWLTEPPDTMYVGIDERATRPELTHTWQLMELYPNPFNSTITVDIAGFTRADFSLRVFDVLGREQAVLQRGALAGGRMSFSAPPDLSSGIYFIVASDHTHRETRKAILIR